jgi:hypothetical protein
MKQSEALDMITKIRLAHQAMESACKRIDELKEENKNLKEALANQEQGEPVANASTWFALVMNAAAELENASIFLRDEDAKRVAISGAKYYRDQANTLYTTPPPKQEQGEPLCTAAMFDDAFLAKSGLSPDTKLYTTPQQRTWVGLTDDEIEMIVENKRAAHWEFIRQVEAKLKEKNT